MKENRVEPSEWVSWALIVVLGAVLGLTLAWKAGAQDLNQLSCPPEATNGCLAKGTAPASPSVDRVCLRPSNAGQDTTGHPAANDPLCASVQPSAPWEIAVPAQRVGTDHQRYVAVACDAELGLCSAPATRTAIVVDLGVPSFFELLRRALGQ